MKKSVLKNKEIYRIGDKALKSIRLSDEEIDRIVAAPHLVDRVHAAIESGQAAAEPDRTSYGRPLRYTLRRQTAWAFAVVLIVAGAIGFFGISRQSYVGQDLAGMIRPAEVPEIMTGPIDIPEIKIVPDDFQKVHEPLRRETAPAVKTRSRVKRVDRAKEIEMGEFQALTYAGDSEEPGEGGRIVRVKLSPASLFAMGVDVPIENEKDRITADLLIGADGVMKSVRLEKKN